jgi:spermidine/putrescine transport system substrate-binding protein
MKFLTALFLGFMATAAMAEPLTLNLFIWSEYLDPRVVAEFERSHNCRVNIDLYEESESMLAKVQNGGAALYDVVVVSDNVIPALTKQNLLAPLRHTNIPNLKNLEERFLNPSYDPGNQFTAAYQWGTMGILYRKTPGKPAPDSWGILFDPKQQAGSFLLMDSMRDTMSAALKFKGWSVNSVDPKQLREIRDLLLEAKKRSVGFDGSVGAKNKILGKTAQAGMVYSGEGVRAVLENKDLGYVVPREGSILWVDSLVVLAKARHRELAEQFINYLLAPDPAARTSRFTQFSTPNKAARELLTKEELANEAVYPGAQTMSRLEFIQDLGFRSRIYDEVWTQVKSR